MFVRTLQISESYIFTLHLPFSLIINFNVFHLKVNYKLLKFFGIYFLKSQPRLLYIKKFINGNKMQNFQTQPSALKNLFLNRGLHVQLTLDTTKF